MSAQRSAAALVALVAISGCGGGDTQSDPFTKVEQRERTRDAVAKGAVAPRWERVTSLSGSGDANHPVQIAPKAVQWRVRWRCTKGRFELSQTPRPHEGNPVATDRCPGTGEAETIDTGELRLAIETEGRWRAVVEQQVTNPVAERPLPGMKAPGARTLARGRFYAIERRGRGNAILYRMADGRLALRFEGFSTSANTDLFVWVSRAPRPRTTKAALRFDHVELALLKSTLGDQNYVLPRRLDQDAIRSIVIWCEPIRIAYTAASLR